MNDIYEYLCLAIVTGWAFAGLFRWILAPRRAVAAGVLLAGALSAGQYLVPETALLSAVFFPVSTGLAVFALADLARPFGLATARRPVLELVVVLMIYLAYLAASLGVVAFDPYSFGYGGYGPAAVAAVLAVHAFLRADPVLGVAIFLAQLTWLAGLGSENLFDHLAGVLLVPALLVGLVRRARDGCPGLSGGRLAP